MSIWGGVGGLMGASSVILFERIGKPRGWNRATVLGLALVVALPLIFALPYFVDDVVRPMFPPS